VNFVQNANRPIVKFGFAFLCSTSSTFCAYEVTTLHRPIDRDVVLGFGNWLSLRTKPESLVLALALNVESLQQINSPTFRLIQPTKHCCVHQATLSYILCFPAMSAPVNTCSHRVDGQWDQTEHACQNPCWKLWCCWNATVHFLFDMFTCDVLL